MYILDSMNMFVGVDDPTSGLWQDISEVKLPTLDQTTQEHMPGGGFMAVSLNMRVIKALEPSFKLVGYNPDVLAKFGADTGTRMLYTAKGNLKDKLKGVERPLKAVMEGCLVKVDPDTFKKGDLLTHDYVLAECFHYEIWIDEVEKLWLDFATNQWRVNGVSVNRQQNLNLGIPQAI